MAELSVARLVAEALARRGPGRAYGIIGTSVLPLFDALYDLRDKVDLVTTRHEQVAVSAADAHARVTGRPGAAIVHAGPGFLNAAISLGIALRDRVPLVLVTGAVRRRLAGTGAWLEIDQEAVSRGVAKEHIRVEDGPSAAEAVRRAFRIAAEPPRGPVVLEVPEDVWAEKARVDPDYWDESWEPAVPAGETERFARDAASLLGEARRPVILACGELAMDPRFRQEDLLRLAERTGAYIVTSGNGRGACPEDHPRCLGRAGFGGGSLVADRALESADLLIVLGNELDDITTYGYNLVPSADILVASLDPLVERRPILTDNYRADPVAALERLLEAAPAARARADWDSVIREAREQWRSVVERSTTTPASRFFRALDALLPRSRVIAAGQGTHVLYAYAYTRVYQPRRFLAATNLGAMGYALPAGIGAAQALGEPSSVIVGDGDLMMTVQDLETIVRERVPVRVALVNDNAYKVLYLRQVIQLGGRVYETLLGNPDFEMLASAFGIPYKRLEPGREREAAEWLARQEGPALVEVPASRDELPPLNLEYTLRMSG